MSDMYMKFLKDRTDNKVIMEKKKTVRIWKRYIPLLIDLLISNNFSSMTFFCATHILVYFYELSVVKV